nr:hypothetical protein BaRGS_025435 [Batillaria attramentaria]
MLSVNKVQDCAGLSDHYLLICGLSLTRPPPLTRLVTSRNLKAVNPVDFQSDVKSLASSVGERHDLDVEGLVDVYDSDLRNAPTLSVFKSSLKTFLFRKAYQ